METFYFPYEPLTLLEGLDLSDLLSGPSAATLLFNASTGEISLTPQERRYAESQLPEQHRFAMITTLFTNSIFWVARQ